MSRPSERPADRGQTERRRDRPVENLELVGRERHPRYDPDADGYQEGDLTFKGWKGNEGRQLVVHSWSARGTHNNWKAYRALRLRDGLIRSIKAGIRVSNHLNTSAFISEWRRTKVAAKPTSSRPSHVQTRFLRTRRKGSSRSVRLRSLIRYRIKAVTPELARAPDPISHCNVQTGSGSAGESGGEARDARSGTHKKTGEDAFRHPVQQLEERSRHHDEAGRTLQEVRHALLDDSNRPLDTSMLQRDFGLVLRLARKSVCRAAGSGSDRRRRGRLRLLVLDVSLLVRLEAHDDERLGVHRRCRVATSQLARGR